ncbi:hypothetical protein [Blastopirellula marina]|nr:hypothetical protein [Blastopirellula marina]
MQIIIKPNGTVRCLYDEVIDLRALGRLAIARGSHVEPEADSSWVVDLAPVNGPHLGPFSQRSEALTAERIWLEANWLSVDT